MSMFKAATAQAIFPTVIWVHDLKPEIAGPLNRKLAEALDRLTRPRPALAPAANWQTDQTLHELPEFAELVEIMRTASAGVMKAMEVEHDGFRITGCWANLGPHGAAHPRHHHPNNYLSGVYYVQTDAGADLITFHEPRFQVNSIAPPLRQANQYNCTTYSLPVEPGRLLLFPSWLVHSVPHNTSDTLRISISFNVMFKNFASTVARPKWTGLPLNVEALRVGEG